MGTWEEESSELFESRNEINKDISSNGTHSGEIDVEVVDGNGNVDGDESHDNESGVVIEEGGDLVKQLESLEFRDNGSDGDKGDGEQLGEYDGANDDAGDEGRNEVYPLRPYAADCSFYIKAGTCKFGQNCRYNHPMKRDYQHVGDTNQGYGESNELAGDAGKIECKYFQTPGGCKYGETCKFIHSASTVGKENVELNFLGLPIRPSAQECVFYLRNGSCGYGSNCRFNHPDPSAVNEFQSANSLENGKPVRGGINLPRNYGVESSPSFRGLSQGSSEPSNSMNTRYGPPYAPDRRPYPQSQVNTSSPANKFPRPHQAVNNFPKRGDPSTQYENPMQVEEFPERPGQPDCDYFMKTGNCKYRSACRYNHPSAQKSNLRPPTLSSKGLYSRPPPMLPAESSQHFNQNFNNTRKKGTFSDNHQNYQVQNGDFPERPEQPECEYYMKTGQCKFMSACRYHHPRNRVPTSSQCALSEKGLPLRPGAKLCRNYEQQGTCKYGRNCLYNHPDDYSPEIPAATDSDTPYATNSGPPAAYNVDSTWDDSWRM